MHQELRLSEKAFSTLADNWNLENDGKRDNLLKNALKSNIVNYIDNGNKEVKELRIAKVTDSIYLITKAKGCNHLVWKHINNMRYKETLYKCLAIKVNDDLIQEKPLVAFNSLFKDSFDELTVGMLLVIDRGKGDA